MQRQEREPSVIDQDSAGLAGPEPNETMSNTTETALTAASPEVQAFLRVWHESERASFERSCPTLSYDKLKPHYAKDRRKFIALDRDGSGVFLLEKATGKVWGIKGYGVPHYGHSYGTLSEFTAKLEAATRQAILLSSATHARLVDKFTGVILAVEPANPECPRCVGLPHEPDDLWLCEPCRFRIEEIARADAIAERGAEAAWDRVYGEEVEQP